MLCMITYMCVQALLAIGHLLETAAESVCGVALATKKVKTIARPEVWMNPKDKAVKMRNSVAAKIWDEAKLNDDYVFEWHGHESGKFQVMKKFRQNASSTASSPAPTSTTPADDE